MLTKTQLKKILKKGKILSDEEFKKIVEDADAKKVALEDHLITKKVISEELLYQAAANYFDIPFVDLKKQYVRKDVLFLVPEPIAQTHKIIAFDKDEKSLKLATLNPKDLQTFEFIKKKTGLEIEISLTTPTSLKDILKQYHKGLKKEFEALGKDTEKAAYPEGPLPRGKETGLEELSKEMPVVKIVDTLLEYAVIEGASDIHIEPTEKDLTIRYRIDGVLKQVMTLPKTVQAGVIARIKVLANLKIDEHRLPQDGRFKITTPEHKVSLRVSIVPVISGEKIVLRLLHETGKVLSLEQLGFLSGPLEIVKRNINKPHGMILVTGPTGSGKTTTLYTILHLLNNPGVNIITIEDPIEYRIPGINQSQISPKVGFTFATGLRSFLRQDPDIIMVGEIRDTETSAIAVHAALTGHLVLSTLHTNDAVTTLPRLLDMEVPAFLIASTTNLIIAQRLVRKICSNCIESYNLEKKAIVELEKQFNMKEILEAMVKEGIITRDQSLGDLLFYRGKGCKQCNQNGYKGRIGIYETLEVTEELSKLILKHASREEFQKAAQRQGMLTVLQDGFIKAKNGITTIEEVLRVTKE